LAQHYCWNKLSASPIVCRWKCSAPIPSDVPMALGIVAVGSKTEAAFFHRDVRSYPESRRWYQAAKIQPTASSMTKITFPRSVNADIANNTHVNPIVYFFILHFSSK
jgi:hypothetical protein